MKVVSNLIFATVLVSLTGCVAVSSHGGFRAPTPAEQQEIDEHSQEGEMRNIR